MYFETHIKIWLNNWLKCISDEIFCSPLCIRNILSSSGSNLFKWNCAARFTTTVAIPHTHAYIYVDTSEYVCMHSAVIHMHVYVYVHSRNINLRASQLSAAAAAAQQSTCCCCCCRCCGSCCCCCFYANMRHEKNEENKKITAPRIKESRSTVQGGQLSTAQASIFLYVCVYLCMCIFVSKCFY